MLFFLAFCMIVMDAVGVGSALSLITGPHPPISANRCSCMDINTQDHAMLMGVEY